MEVAAKAAVAAAETLYMKKFLFFHINLYAGHLNIDMTLWYTYVVYVDVNVLLMLLLPEYQFHLQLHFAQAHFKRPSDFIP